ncbi:laminin G domain-containing protein [Lysinibacillus sp. M3]|uniref:Laminin G domain-containing protein n=1 Tax=Lysinibacillus zambalensis TaxID=3160866 RepID=A0ABV1MT25_9BACI
MSNNNIPIENEKTRIMMDKHGLYWFQFNEDSGDALDSKGSLYKGALSNVTRVEAWDGTGHSLSFNGNSLATFNNSLMTYGEKTVVFRFKTTSDSNMYLFENYATSTVNQTGYNILINKGVIVARRFTSTGGNATFAFVLASPKAYNDGEWHKVLFSWTGNTQQKANLYIDDELVASESSTANETSSNFATQNMVLGGCKLSTYRQYFTGQIDDFQYYNKTLTPKDFTLNKSLVLHDGEYKKFENDWLNTSSTLPTSNQFLEQGMDSLSTLLDRKVTTLKPMLMTDKSEILNGEDGKVFSKSIDLKKHFDIRSIKIEVKQ